MLPFIVFVEFTIINSTEVKFRANREQEEYEIFFTRSSMEINTNMHLLELSIYHDPCC